ncbi:MAG: IPT/TIG domain-containing protein [Candidatus Poribacteria bacterium]|nr:IPT/TIG domain-containing protein [Candidatus Poribacteria bacterium]
MKYTIYALCLAVCFAIPANSHAATVLSVRGLVTNVAGDAVDGLAVTVTNTSKNLTDTRFTGEGGPGVYSAVFIDFSNRSVADTGDEIRVTISQEGQIVAEVIHILTAEDIEQRAAEINVQLEEKPPAPILTRVEPSNGIVTGGTSLQIIGENFQDGATVTIGGNDAIAVTFVSSTELTAQTPAGVAGDVDVVVTNPDGQSVTLSDGFTYTSLPPVIVGLNPASGSVTGGMVFTITGENFQEGAVIAIGGNAAAAVTFVSSTELTAQTPAGAAGGVDVVVTNPDGQTVTLAGGFTYTSLPPVVEGIAPTSGPVTGGTAVTITGDNFQDGATVRFGENDATDVTFVSDSELTATAPAGEAGEAVVTVINPDGQEVMLTTFTYTLLLPVITNITPDNDTTVGGTSLTLVGENFQEGATVTIGGNEATDVTFVSSTELMAQAPAGVTGDADVVITNPDGGSATLASGFAYTPPPPIVIGIDPTNGLVTGGAAATITGDNFQEGVTVRFGENEASDVTFVSDSELTVTVPAGEAGQVVVTVVNPDGQEATPAIQFTYTLLPPAITSITPDNDMTAGGASVAIAGGNFQAGASVTFGGNPAIDVVVTSDMEIAATVPAASAGLATVVVTNPDGQSAQIEFTYIEFPPWDVDQNGVTDVFDLVRVGGKFGQTGTGLPEDVNGDGTVDIFDLSTVGIHFGETSTPAAPSSGRIAADRKFTLRADRRASKLEPEASRRLRTALTELEHLSDTTPEVVFVTDLLRQWLIEAGEIPANTQLLPNYPNPFNPETWIPYQLAQASDVRISIYNVIGQRVRELAVGLRHAGIYRSRSESAYWDGRNDAGERITSGVYFYTLRTNAFVATRKMIILK